MGLDFQLEIDFEGSFLTDEEVEKLKKQLSYEIDEALNMYCELKDFATCTNYGLNTKKWEIKWN